MLDLRYNSPDIPSRVGLPQLSGGDKKLLHHCSTILLTTVKIVTVYMLTQLFMLAGLKSQMKRRRGRSKTGAAGTAGVSAATQKATSGHQEAVWPS